MIPARPGTTAAIGPDLVRQLAIYATLAIDDAIEIIYLDIG